MQIEHVYTFKNTPREVVWERIQNEEVLENALPGCKEFRETGKDKYFAVLGINMGPIKGEFESEVEQVDKDEPNQYRLIVKAKGKPGEISADALLQFEETDEGTVLKTTADVQVTGLLASIDQRVMGGVAKVVIGNFFKAVEKEVSKVV